MFKSEIMKAYYLYLYATLITLFRFTIEFSDLIQPVILDLERNNDTAGLKETKERIQAQVPLRMASCIHLCLKLHADLATAVRYCFIGIPAFKIFSLLMIG